MIHVRNRQGDGVISLNEHLIVAMTPLQTGGTEIIMLSGNHFVSTDELQAIEEKITVSEALDKV